MTALLQTRILTVLVFLPSAAAALLLLFPRSRSREAKIFAIGASLVELALALPLWSRLDLHSGTFQFTETTSWVPALGITYSLGMDGISLLLVLLTLSGCKKAPHSAA